VARKKRQSAEDKKRRQQEWDESFLSLRRFLADPVAKQALSRLKKKDSKLTSLLQGIEASVQSGRVPGRAPSEEEEALLEQIFGKPTEEERKASDAQLEEWLADFREVEKQFNAEWKEKTGETPPRIKTDDDVEKVISWWKEKAALAEIDSNAILAAEDHEVFAWEPVVKGRMTLLKLQAATLAATPSAKTPPPEAAEGPAADRPANVKDRASVGKDTTENEDMIFMSFPAICATLGVPDVKVAAAKKTLDRARLNHDIADDDWVEVAEPKPRQPRYQYRLSIARRILKKYVPA
jgi:hypothetical protein